MVMVMAVCYRWRLNDRGWWLDYRGWWFVVGLGGCKWWFVVVMTHDRRWPENLCLFLFFILCSLVLICSNHFDFVIDFGFIRLCFWFY